MLRRRETVADDLRLLAHAFEGRRQRDGGRGRVGVPVLPENDQRAFGFPKLIQNLLSLRQGHRPGKTDEGSP
ncbi:hypothetical protein D3C83_146750 [compost metagenome]